MKFDQLTSLIAEEDKEYNYPLFTCTITKMSGKRLNVVYYNFLRTREIQKQSSIKRFKDAFKEYNPTIIEEEHLFVHSYTTEFSGERVYVLSDDLQIFTTYLAAHHGITENDAIYYTDTSPLVDEEATTEFRNIIRGMRKKGLKDIGYEDPESSSDIL
jgi:hypothetical protein